MALPRADHDYQPKNRRVGTGSANVPIRAQVSLTPGSDEIFDCPEDLEPDTVTSGRGIVQLICMGQQDICITFFPFIIFK